ncbi:MAG: thiolase family protein [Thermoanaerobaculia bacterium]
MSHLPEPLVLVGPTRTPIGRFGGALSTLSAADLGTAAARAALERAGVEAHDVDQVIFGHARQAGGGPNTARQIAYRAGIPVDRTAFTVNQACGSGLQAVLCAARAIRLGEAELILAGGTESMSNTPYLLPRARWGYRLGHAEVIDGMYQDGFNDPLSELVMGETAEELATESGIDRLAADGYAARSQSRYQAAVKNDRWSPEITPLTVETPEGSRVISEDEHPREGVTVESLAKLKTVFRSGGTVTAGNASGITDGAAALIVTTEALANRLNIKAAGRLLDWEEVGVDPRIMGIGPVPAVQKLLERNRLAYSDIDQVEINEAFSSQVLACLKELAFDEDRVNPDGGAIALGHPIGCTGTRILVSLLHGLEMRSGRLGVATLCVSGGLGIAALVERVDQLDEIEPGAD